MVIRLLRKMGFAAGGWGNIYVVIFISPARFYKDVQNKIDMQTRPRYGYVSHLQCDILLAHLVRVWC